MPTKMNTYESLQSSPNGMVLITIKKKDKNPHKHSSSKEMNESPTIANKHVMIIHRHVMNISERIHKSNKPPEAMLYFNNFMFRENS